jgi:DNA-binding beta-propeller fold protein YncE
MERYQEKIIEKLFRNIKVMFLGVALAGCGGGKMMMTPPPVTMNTSFAFVANTNSNTVSAFQVDSQTGTLFPISGGTFPTGIAPEFMAVDSGSKFLFVANSNSNDVSVFAIDPTKGNLTAAPGSPFPAGTQPKGLAVVSSANLLFVANNGSDDISVFKFDGFTGALTPAAGSPLKGVPTPIGVATDALGKFLYVTNTNLGTLASTNSISAFSIDTTTGALTPAAGSPFATGTTPIGLAADPNEMFVYVGDHMANVSSTAAAISAFNVSATDGSLTRVGGAPSQQASCGISCHNNPLHPLRLAIHPAARFAYVTGVGENSVFAFSLSNGFLTAAASPVATGQHPFGMAFDPTGIFLYVANKVDNNISGYSVNSMTGMLTPLSHSPFPVGSGPVGIVIVRKP